MMSADADRVVGHPAPDAGLLEQPLQATFGLGLDAGTAVARQPGELPVAPTSGLLVESATEIARREPPLLERPIEQVARGRHRQPAQAVEQRLGSRSDT